MRRRKDISWSGIISSMILTLILVAFVANPLTSLAATHTSLTESGTSTT